MTLQTKNLGIVQAIFVGIIPPTNTNMLWRDTSSSPHTFKSFDNLTSSWVELSNNLANTDLVQTQIQRSYTVFEDGLLKFVTESANNTTVIQFGENSNERFSNINMHSQTFDKTVAVFDAENDSYGYVERVNPNEYDIQRRTDISDSLTKTNRIYLTPESSLIEFSTGGKFEARLTQTIIEHRVGHSGGRLSLSETGNTFEDFNSTKRGIQYIGDYSADFTDRSLIDKAFAEKTNRNYIDIANFISGYTLVANDAGSVITNSNANVRTLVIPSGLALPNNMVSVKGRIAIQPETGVNITLPDGSTITDPAQFTCVADEVYILHKSAFTGDNYILVSLKKSENIGTNDLIITDTIRELQVATDGTLQIVTNDANNSAIFRVGENSNERFSEIEFNTVIFDLLSKFQNPSITAGVIVEVNPNEFKFIVLPDTSNTSVYHGLIKADANKTIIEKSNAGKFMFDSSLSINTFEDLRATKKGLEYSADYSANFSVRSLVDKGYVDSGLSLKLNIADAYGGKRYTLIKPNGTKEFYDTLTQVRSNWADGDVLHQFADEQITYADAGSGRMFILPAISWNGNGFKLDLVGTIVGSGTFFYCDNKQIYLFNLNIKFSGTAGTSRYIFHAFNSSVINGNSTVNVYSTSQVTLFREQNTSYFYNFNSFENASNVDLFVAGGAGGFYNIEAKGGILGANLNLFNCKFFNVTGNISGEFNNCFFELVAGTSIATSLTYTLNDCTVIRRGAGAGSTNLFGGDNMTLNNSIVIDYDGRTFSFSSGDDVIINNSTILNYSNNAVAYLLNTADSVISDSYIYANKICLSSNSNNGGKVVSSHIISRDENPVAFGNFNLIGCKLETRTSAKAIFTDNHDFLDCIFVGSNTPYTSTIKANNPYRLTQSIDHLGNVGAGLRSIYPKMTTAERDVLTGVEKGYAIENTTTNFLQVYNGSTWKDLLDLT